MIKIIKRIVEIILIIILTMCNNVFAMLTPGDLKDLEYEIGCKLPGDTYNLFEDWRFWAGISMVIIIIVCLIIHFKKKKEEKSS